jgi:hypothetical protein
MTDNRYSLERDLSLLNVTDTYREYVAEFVDRLLLAAKVKILIVVDDEISLTPSPGAFGIGRVVQLIRATSTACMTFTVDLARRSALPAATNANPTPTQPKYTGFRFDQNNANGKPIVNDYHEIWCFGFKPDNSGGPDGNISNPAAFPIEDAELKVLTTWMNEKKGGIFATGDHDYLGASMCGRIPRVGTMRKWTNAQGVPTIGGTGRIDTNRPANDAQADIDGNPPVPEMMGFDNQSDEFPQPIEWVAWSTIQISPYFRRKSPHPVLCHPTHGPINVMPDHPHEGLCFDTKVDPVTGVPEIKLDGEYNFAGYTGKEYPEVAGVRPTPRVIAYGKTLPDPPYNHEKGDSPEKRFPMISIYDGHRIGVGRVAVDSTWHHWMDINLTGLEAAADQTNWEKISRYFINLAVWLSPRQVSRFCLMRVIFQSQFEYFGFQEVSPVLSPFEIGRAFRWRYKNIFGPCWTTQLVLDWVKEATPKIYERLYDEYFVPKFPPDPECLSCPPLEQFEDAVLGGMILEVYDMIQPIRREMSANTKPAARKQVEQATFEKQLINGAVRGVKAFNEAMDVSLKTSNRRFLK